MCVGSMNETKKKTGRPRKYATNAERQRAYYERKKQRIRELEERLAILERKQKLDSNNNSNDSSSID